MVTEGRYRAIGRTAQVGVNKNGKDYVSVAFEIIGGEHAAEIVTDIWYFASEKSTAITVQKLQAAGVTFTRNDITDLEGFGECEVEIALRLETTPSGKDALRIQYVSEPGAARGKELEPADRAAMRARWATVLASAKKPPRARDEMPF